MKPSDMRRRGKARILPSEKEKEAGKVFPVHCDDGSVRWYRAEDGSPVDSPGDKRYYRPYDRSAALLVGQCIAKGMTVKGALEETGLPYTTYLAWRRERPDFVSVVETGRRLRAEAVHESMAEELASVASPSKDSFADMDGMDAPELAEAAERNKARLGALRVLEKKQGLLRAFVKEDAPNRFGVSKQVVETRSDGSVMNLSVDIPDEYARAIKEAFTPEIQNDGALTVKGLPVPEEAEKDGA